MKITATFWLTTEDGRKANPGDVIEVSQAEGTALIYRGYAVESIEAVEPTSPPSVEEPIKEQDAPSTRRRNKDGEK